MISSLKNSSLSGKVSSLDVSGNSNVGGSAAVTGNLAVDTNTLFVDSANNRVGIGTSSPTTELEIRKNVLIKGNDDNGAEYYDWPNPSLAIRRSDDYIVNGVTMISLGYRNDPLYGTDQSVSNIRIYDAGQSANATTSSSTTILKINSPGTISLGSGGVEDRLVVDPSGRILSPNQPCFVAKRTGGVLASPTFITYDSVVINVGGHYNSSNGRFTAPVAGTYLFNIYDIGSNTATTRFYLYKNGVTTLGTQTHQLRIPNGADYGSGLSYWMISANANDYFQVQMNAGSSYGTNEYSWFYGYLLG